MSAAPYDTLNVGDHVGDDPAAVGENRERVAGAAGLAEPAEWVWLDQVHGVRVHVATEPTRAPPEADAAVTATPGLPIAVLTADCAPVAPRATTPWEWCTPGHRGLEHGVIQAAVAALREIGTGTVRACSVRAFARRVTSSG